MVERKFIATKINGKNYKPVKPSRYIDMVIDAMQSLKDSKGSIPKNIVGYIANSYSLTADKKAISSSVYRALKQALDNDLILKNSYGHYNLSAKGKRRKVPAKRKRKRRRGRKKGKRRKKGRKRRKKRRKGKKRGKKRRRRSKRRRSKRRKSKRIRRQEEDSDEPRRRRRKKNPED